MKPILSKTQHLKEVSKGLWVADKSSKKDFSYSDGTQFEQYLTETIKNTNDLSSSSEDLDAAGIDWPSTYHLSSKRNHIIAGLNLGKNSRVIEIGSGCGAITRYLADLGHRVDAIEGSLARASIARERCRDKSNVNVIVANFNDLILPEKTYDLALFIGVLEYAQRFGAEYSSPEQAVLGMLEKSLNTIVPDGCIVVAIENRIGFKYAYGAAEDHYGRPYVGLSGYPTIPGTQTLSKANIATYSQDEWKRILSRIRGLHYGFFYPFPDYKLADVVLSESFVHNNNNAANLIRKTLSFDPTSNWRSPINEYCYWRHAAQLGSLGKSANSFGFVIAKQLDSVKKKLDFDFVCFPNQKRKKIFQTRVEKKSHAARVTRIAATTNQEENVLFRLEPKSDDYQPGKLLVDYWADILQSNPEPAALRYIVLEMHKNITSLLAQETDEQYNLDLTILNIIVDAEGHWHAFDREWFSAVPITTEILMFRSLLYFACIYPEHLIFTEKMGWHTVFDFVDGCFAFLNIDFPSRYIEFVSFENQFQQYALKTQHYIPAEVRLSQTFERIFDSDAGLTKFFPKLYLADQTGVFTDARSRKMEIPICTIPRDLYFSILEAKLEPGGMLRLRFDPTDENSAHQERTLKLSKMVVSIRQGGREKRLWLGDHDKDILNKMKIRNLSIKKRQGDVFYEVRHPDPQMVFEHRLPNDIGHVGTILLKVRLSLN